MHFFISCSTSYAALIVLTKLIWIASEDSYVACYVLVMYLNIADTSSGSAVLRMAALVKIGSSAATLTCLVCTALTSSLLAHTDKYC